MKAKVTRTPYPKFVPDGTIGEIIGAVDNGVMLRVDGTFPDTNPSPELGKTDFYFDRHQVEFIVEKQIGGTAPEEAFVAFCNIIAIRLQVAREWADPQGYNAQEQLLAATVARILVHSKRHGLRVAEMVAKFIP